VLTERSVAQLNPLMKRHAALCNLSSALCSRFTLTREYEDVKEAINLCQESLEALPSLHPERYYSFVRLREAYLSRYRILHYPADLSLAMENFQLASRHPTQGFPGRLIDAYNWTVTAETYSPDSALEAYTTFFDLDGHLVTQSSTISRREAAAAFRDISRLPVDAASCAIRRNNLRHAVELVEQGHGQRFKTSVEDLESQTRRWRSIIWNRASAFPMRPKVLQPSPIELLLIWQKPSTGSLQGSGKQR
jgi:hypothetical protein